MPWALNGDQHACLYQKNIGGQLRERSLVKRNLGIRIESIDIDGFSTGSKCGASVRACLEASTSNVRRHAMGWLNGFHGRR